MTEQYNSPNYFKQKPEDTNLTRIKQITNGMTHTIENQLNNPNNQYTRPNFRQVITDSQKTIQEINKEALKEFQSMIKNEIQQSQYQHQEGSYMQQYEIAGERREFDTCSDFGTIITVDDVISEDERDSMDTDSLLNAQIETPDFNFKQTENKKDGENDSFNLVNRYVDFNHFNHAKKAQQKIEPLQKNYSDPFKNVYKNMNEDTSSNQESSNCNMNKRKNCSTNNFVTIASESTVNDIQQNAAIPTKISNKQVKSILKRSSSLDNGSSALIGAKISNVNFGLKSDKNVIKDSIELTNGRLNPNMSKTNILTSDNNRKKSVRFAALFHTEEFNESPKEKPKEALVENTNLTNVKIEALISNSNLNEKISTTNTDRNSLIF